MLFLTSLALLKTRLVLEPPTIVVSRTTSSTVRSGSRSEQKFTGICAQAPSRDIPHPPTEHRSPPPPCQPHPPCARYRGPWRRTHRDNIEQQQQQKLYLLVSQVDGSSRRRSISVIARGSTSAPYAQPPTQVSNSLHSWEPAIRGGARSDEEGFLRPPRSFARRTHASLASWHRQLTDPVAIPFSEATAHARSIQSLGANCEITPSSSGKPLGNTTRLILNLRHAHGLQWRRLLSLSDLGRIVIAARRGTGSPFRTMGPWLPSPGTSEGTLTYGQSPPLPKAVLPQKPAVRNGSATTVPQFLKKDGELLAPIRFSTFRCGADLYGLFAMSSFGRYAHPVSICCRTPSGGAIGSHSDHRK